MPSAWVLGIGDDVLAGVALFRDGRPVFAAAEERFSRRKAQSGFPRQALQAALDFAGIRADELSAVLVANRSHFVYRWLAARFRDYQHDFFSLSQKAYLLYHDAVHAFPPLPALVERVNRHVLSRRLPVTRFYAHHRVHAASAVYSSGFEEGLAVTVDNLGDGDAAAVWIFGPGPGGRTVLRRLYASPASRSPGQFYGEVTQLLGFNPLRHAGKVTGLAGYGDPGPAGPIVEQIFSLTEDGRDFRLLPSALRWARRGPYWALSLFPPEDVAAAAQARLEQVVGGYVRRALEITGARHLVLAGGVFANVSLNRLLHRLPGVEALHVHPAMSDEGLGFGAAAAWLLEQGHRPARLENAYLGPTIEREQALRALQEHGLQGWPASPGQLAELLARGRVVARAAGRLEYGPRALGNRSILYRPDDGTVRDWLNERLRRTEFMPFAPVARVEDGDELFGELDGARDPARFMTIALPVQPAWRERLAGVVHADGTARPQLVSREENPELHELLGAYRERTGLPCLINTSFNLHEEPIVGSAGDALRAFLEADLDHLWLAGLLVPNPRLPGRVEEARELLGLAGSGR